MKPILAAALAVTLSSAAAQAGPAADLVQSRIRAIASGDVAAIVADYGRGAQLHWVGGPLDGTYKGVRLREVWSKFSKANAPLQASVGAVTESANPKGATASVPVVFTAKGAIKVRYAVTVRDGRVVSETWQIDPNLSGV
jgi:hypothetical protein